MTYIFSRVDFISAVVTAMRASAGMILTLVQYRVIMSPQSSEKLCRDRNKIYILGIRITSPEIKKKMCSKV